MFSFPRGIKSFNDDFRTLIEEGANAQHNNNIEANIEVLKKIKDYNPDAMIDSLGTHFLHLLAEYNNIKLIDYCIKAKYNLKVEDGLKRTPMMIAISHGHFEAACKLHTAYVDSIVEEILSKPSILMIVGPPMSKVCSAATREALRLKIEDSVWPDILIKCENAELSHDIIARIFIEIAGFDLSEIVKFGNANLTKAFLQSIPRADMSEIEFEEVVGTYKAEHVKVIVTQQFDNDYSYMPFFVKLVINNIAEYHKVQAARNFLISVFSWDELTIETLGYFVKELQSASKKNVEVFLQYDFHFIAKDKWNIDILGSLFGNQLVDATSFLSVDETNVDKRYIYDNTALHFAAKSCILENIKFLLRKQADANASNSEGVTPLCLALTIKKPNIKCIEKLIFGGADFLSIDHYLTNVVFNVGHDNFLTDKCVVKMIGAHMAIISEMGLLDQTLLQTYNDYTNIREMQPEFQEYCKQVKDMSAHKIHDRKSYEASAITIFTFISKKLEDIVLLINKADLEVIKKILKRNKTSWDSYYQKIIKKRMQQITRIYRSKEKLALILCRCLNVKDPYHLVVQQILGYFCVKGFLYSRYT